MTIDKSAIERHYTRGDLLDRILAALAATGKDIDALVAADLSPVDEFHTRGRDATDELAVLAGITADLRVLDVGSGIGGPARRLASERGCRVTGIDLTVEFVRTATALSQRVGLADRVSFVAGDALDLPFPDGSLDVAWTQHAAMNIADRPRLYAEMHRVLRPGGRLALQDVLAGSGGPPHFPVPWARRPEDSVLVDETAQRRLLVEAGFAVREWRDVTGTAAEWFAARRARLQSVPLGIGLLLGDDLPAMMANQERNLVEGRVVVLQAVAVRDCPDGAPPEPEGCNTCGLLRLSEWCCSPSPGPRPSFRHERPMCPPSAPATPGGFARTRCRATSSAASRKTRQRCCRAASAASRRRPKRPHGSAPPKSSSSAPTRSRLAGASPAA